MKFEKVCVLGLGYTGLPTAAMFATHGIQVVGVDINDQVINTLNNGGIHIQEIGLRALVQQAMASGRLVASLNPEAADAFVIEVPTPFYEDKKADMRAVVSASEAIIPYLKRGNLVVLESTSPPLTTSSLVLPILERSGLKAGVDFYLAYSPERVLPGQILKELVENARVIGGINPPSAEAGRDLFLTFVTGEIVLTDATTAEMVKLMENTYRDINVAIANEFARLAERFGIDGWEAIALASRHPRVKILNPGPGVGGHCIGVDPWFLVEAAPDLTPLIQMARSVNDSQPEFVLKLVERALSSSLGLALAAGKESSQVLLNRHIAVLGLAYKANVDDLRESPAIEIARLLASAGAIVVAYEPLKPEARFESFETVITLEEALRDAELILLLAGHQIFRDLDAQKIAGMTAARIAVDTINGWNAAQWRAAGFDIYRLGDGTDRLQPKDASIFQIPN